jgi:hypothetical protein
MERDTLLRQQLAKMIDWDEAHADLSTTVQGIPAELRGKVPEGLPHSAWQLLEHIRIALWDILEFTRDGKHQSPKWPEEYWPASVAPPSDKAWDESLKTILKMQEEFRKLIRDPSHDLYKPLPHGDGQTLLREALLAADHGAYHLGQLVLVRKALGAWPA